MTQPLPRTLFVGRGASAVCWYRCAIPAMVLGADWIGAAGDPPHVQALTGVAPKTLAYADFFDYEVVVLQQPFGLAWVRAIRELQAAGVKVLFEIDDYVQGIRKMHGDHDFAGKFGKEQSSAYELCMSVCDGIIVSTEFLARRYRAHNKNVFVCGNGLDLKRYALTRPQSERVTIGWAGATGHRGAVRSWLSAVTDVMRARPETNFLSVGQSFADDLVEEFGVGRARSVPFADLQCYPAAMTAFDLALAPAGKGNFFRGKSDLRWLEASALGIPLIADPDVYPNIEHGVTGFHAETTGEVRELIELLIADPDLAHRVGAAAQAHVREHRSAEVAAQQWAEVLRECAPPMRAGIAPEPAPELAPEPVPVAPATGGGLRLQSSTQSIG